MKWLMYFMQGLTILTFSGIINDLIEKYIVGFMDKGVLTIIGAIVVIVVVNILTGFWVNGVIKFFNWE